MPDSDGLVLCLSSSLVALLALVGLDPGGSASRTRQEEVTVGAAVRILLALGRHTVSCTGCMSMQSQPSPALCVCEPTLTGAGNMDGSLSMIEHVRRTQDAR